MLCSPQRLARPWQGQVEANAPGARRACDPGCYLCPGNARAGGEVNPPYTGTFAFDNDFPALLRTSDQAGVAQDDILHRVAPATGVCRVLCFSPRHDLTLGAMGASGIRLVVDACAAPRHEALRHTLSRGARRWHRPTPGTRR